MWWLKASLAIMLATLAPALAQEDPVGPRVAPLRPVGPAAPEPEPGPTPAPEDGTKATETLQDCPDCPRLTLIPARRHAMGPTAREKYINAKTSVEIEIAAFLIGVHEVSIAEWLACQDAGVCPRSSIRIEDESSALPVTGITKAQIDVYLDWLNGLTGRGYRLPSEAEWEAAALAGADTIFAWGDAPDRAFGNFGPLTLLDPDLGAGKLLPVDSQKPNGLGVFGMVGNALELTGDCYEDDLAHLPRNGAPYWPAGCRASSAKGGDYLAAANFARPRFRRFVPVEDASPLIGFRVARDLRGGDVQADDSTPPPAQ